MRVISTPVSMRIWQPAKKIVNYHISGPTDRIGHFPLSFGESSPALKTVDKNWHCVRQVEGDNGGRYNRVEGAGGSQEDTAEDDDHNDCQDEGIQW